MQNTLRFWRMNAFLVHINIQRNKSHNSLLMHPFFIFNTPFFIRTSSSGINWNKADDLLNHFFKRTKEKVLYQSPLERGRGV